MSAMTYKVTTLRGASSVSQIGAGRKLVSADGTRWAISRNQKRAIGNRQWDVVECWTLKCRVNGKVVTKDIQRGEEEAKAWVA